MSADGEHRIGLAVVGYGYWGPNIVRNVVERPEFDLVTLCELSSVRADEFRKRYPGIPVEPDFRAVLADPRVEAVAIATRPHTHYDLVRRALEAGKHVLVEKPMASTGQEASDLIAIAEEGDRLLMPGHTFLYSPPVVKVRELIREGVLGDAYFITSSRMNLGIYQPDGVLCDLAPHDISILLYWLDRPLVQVSAIGRSVFRADIHETAFLTLTFEGGTTANVQVSWLAPRKVRQMVVVGSKRMIQYEDTAADEPVKVYDRGFDFDLTQPANFGEYRLSYRTGDLVVPRVEAHEPLSLELQDFARCIRTHAQPRSHAKLGHQIVCALEAAQLSLARNGEPVAVSNELGGPAPVRRVPFGRWNARRRQLAER